MFQTCFMFHFIYGMSSFPLTNSIIFQDGYCTTNQIYYQTFWSLITNQGLTSESVVNGFIKQQTSHLGSTTLSVFCGARCRGLHHYRFRDLQDALGHALSRLSQFSICPVSKAKTGATKGPRQPVRQEHHQLDLLRSFTGGKDNLLRLLLLCRQYGDAVTEAALEAASWVATEESTLAETAAEVEKKKNMEEEQFASEAKKAEKERHDLLLEAQNALKEHRLKTDAAKAAEAARGPGKHPKHDTGNQHFSWVKSRVSKCCHVHQFSSQAVNVYQMIPNLGMVSTPLESIQNWRTG